MLLDIVLAVLVVVVVGSGGLLWHMVEDWSLTKMVGKSIQFVLRHPVKLLFMTFCVKQYFPLEFERNKSF